MPRKELMEDIDRIIKQAAIEGTLTEDAIGYYNGLIKLAEEKEAENAELKRQLATANENNQILQREITEVTARLDAWATREADLKDREEKCTQLECKVEMHETRVRDHQEMVRLIFRNPVTTSQVVTPGHPGHVDQYGNTQNQAWPETHDVKSEDT